MRAGKLHWSTLLLMLLMGAAAARAENIRLFYFPPWNVSKLPLYFARDTGIFEKAGLNIS